MSDIETDDADDAEFDFVCVVQKDRQVFAVDLDDDPSAVATFVGASPVCLCAMAGLHEAIKVHGARGLFVPTATTILGFSRLRSLNQEKLKEHVRLSVLRRIRSAQIEAAQIADKLKGWKWAQFGYYELENEYNKHIRVCEQLAPAYTRHVEPLFVDEQVSDQQT